MQVALRKKQLAVSFGEHFKQNHENKICVSFQFYNPKLSQKSKSRKYYILKICALIANVTNFLPLKDTLFEILFMILAHSSR